MIIKVYDVVKISTLRHRDTARRVLQIVEKVQADENITIDFSGITFASRSFCHELKKDLKHRDVEFINMLSEVEEMMYLVQHKPRINIMDPLPLKKLRLVTT